MIIPAGGQLDRERAAGAQLMQSITVTTVGDEPLAVDLSDVLQETPGYHWVCEQLMLIAHLATRAPADSRGFPPFTGLYLCPPGTAAPSLADGQTTGVNWNQEARPILIPMGLPAGDFATLGAGPPFAMVMTAAPGFKFTVPRGWFVRGILVCQQGTATPGPGAGSVGRLRGLFYQEKDDPCK